MVISSDYEEKIPKNEPVVLLCEEMERSDSNTLIPFLKMSERELGFKYENVVADAGYDSEENFVYLSKNKQEAYIKPTTYERSKTRRYKNDIGLAENMYYSSS